MGKKGRLTNFIEASTTNNGTCVNRVNCVLKTQFPSESQAWHGRSLTQRKACHGHARLAPASTLPPPCSAHSAKWVCTALPPSAPRRAPTSFSAPCSPIPPDSTLASESALISLPVAWTPSHTRPQPVHTSPRAWGAAFAVAPPRQGSWAVPRAVACLRCGLNILQRNPAPPRYASTPHSSQRYHCPACDAGSRPPRIRRRSRLVSSSCWVPTCARLYSRNLGQPPLSPPSWKLPRTSW